MQTTPDHAGTSAAHPPRGARTIPGMRLCGTLALGLMLVAGAPAVGRAQEASPVSATCEAPALPPGTPTALEELASPAAMAPMDATPEAAAPEATAEPAGIPADAANAERVTSAAENLIGCLSTGNALGFAALVTPVYLQSEFGITNPYDMQYVFDGMPSFELLAAEHPQIHADGRISVEITSRVGENQVDRFRAYFIEGDQGYLLLDQEVALPVAGDITVEVTMLDYAFEMSQTTIPAGGIVSFEITNAGQYPHEFVVVQLPEGVTVEEALADPALGESVMFLAGTFAEPGQVAYTGLTGLTPGTYTVVCFVDTPEGIPHVMRGMVAELTVE